MGASEEEAGGLQPTPARQVPDYMMLQFWGLYGRREGERREQQRPAGTGPLPPAAALRAPSSLGLRQERRGRSGLPRIWGGRGRLLLPRAAEEKALPRTGPPRPNPRGPGSSASRVWRQRDNSPGFGLWSCPGGRSG